MPTEFFFLSEPLQNPAAPTIEELRKGVNITSAITNANFTLGNTPSTKENNMNTFTNTHGNKTFTVADSRILVTYTNGDVLGGVQVKESDLTAIAASVLELYGTPEKGTDNSYVRATTDEGYADLPTSDEALLWQAYARLKALGIRAERKAAQEAEKAAKDAALQQEADAATLLEEAKDRLAWLYTGKYFSELGRTKKALVSALAHEQIALVKARVNGAK